MSDKNKITQPTAMNKRPVSTCSPAMQRLLSVLGEKGDMSASDLAREAYVGVTTLACGGYLKALRKARLVHVSGWRKTRIGFVTPLYSLGDRPDLPRPEFRDIDRASPGLERIVSVLREHGPMTYREIAAASGLSPNTIKNARYMDILSSQRRVHIVDWRRNRAGPMVALYGAGAGRNAPRPEALSDSEKRLRSRRKTQALGADRGLLAQLERL